MLAERKGRGKERREARRRGRGLPWYWLLLGSGGMLLLFSVLGLAQSNSPLENFLRRTLRPRPSQPVQPVEPPESLPLTPPQAPESLPSASLLIIDPGHGGADGGARGRQGEWEKEITLRLAQRLATQMEGVLPFVPVLTRQEDVLMSGEERASFANSQQGVLFLSIHTGGAVPLPALVHRIYVSAGPQQQEVSQPPPLQVVRWDQAQYPYRAASLRLGEAVQAGLRQALGEPVQLWTHTSLSPLAFVQMPAILIEVGQLAAPAEQRFTDPRYLDRIVQGIIAGIRAYTDSLAEVETSATTPSPR